MKASHYIKNLKLVERNREWLTSSIPTSHKVGYYPSIALSYLRLFSQNTKHINYLGRAFHYDNPATPLNLQNYPNEVGEKILRFMSKPPKSVLDIGANLGQFACTMAALAGNTCTIDSFEPNPSIHELLNKNATPNIKTYNYALADKKGELTFYFEEGRSAIGSFFKENAGNPDNLKELKVKTITDPSEVTSRQKYDLIKVDVEGFEYEVLQSLKNISAKYLYLEVSGAGRKRSYTDSALMELISKALGQYEILYHSRFEKGQPTYEMLLSFN